MQKLLLKAPRPSLGLALLKAWGMLPVVAPELLPLEATPQDPAWHPEGDVWAHTLQVVDLAASLIDEIVTVSSEQALEVALTEAALPAIAARGAKTNRLRFKQDDRIASFSGGKGG